ncbi:hypothetical protein ANO14919_079210 [Xylariales sp. No.14919]|nr:hypothetical protein ANO14919_079210 [Xylariales sp. No.14919]
MKGEILGAYYLGTFAGIIAGTLGTYWSFRSHPSSICPAHVSNTTPCNQSYLSHPTNSSNPSNHGGSQDLKTYMYKCGIWESNTTQFSTANPINIDPDAFDRLINGTQPLDTTTYACTLNYQSFR